MSIAMGDRAKQQLAIVALVAIIILATLYLVSKLMPGGQDGLGLSGAGANIDPRIVADRTSGASPEDVWIGSAEQQINQLTALVEDLKTDLQEERMAAANDLAALEREIAERIEMLEGQTADAFMDHAERIANIGSGAGNTDPLGDGTEATSGTVAPGEPQEVASLTEGLLDSGFFSRSGDTRLAATDLTEDPAADGTPSQRPQERMPFMVSLTLSPKDTALPGPGEASTRTLEAYVPAGSYAPAIVLTGADAKTGVKNAASPIPVVLKLTGPAVAPSDGPRTRSIDLTGCRAIGSAIADLSSERVSVRLDTLSCVRGNHVLEASIAGYVSGQGQQGVRGRLVSRAGPAVTNAGIAAALEGLAGSAAGTGTSIIGLESAESGDVISTLPLRAAGAGVSGAAGKLAEYYINRAEEISPVVSLYAGTNVNVVFLEGVDMDPGR